MNANSEAKDMKFILEGKFEVIFKNFRFDF